LNREAPVSYREHPPAASQMGPVQGWQIEQLQFENMNLSSPGSRRRTNRTHAWDWQQGISGIDQAHDPHKFDPLYIEDPLRTTNNVGRNCFRIMQIRRAFAAAFTTLTGGNPTSSDFDASNYQQPFGSSSSSPNSEATAANNIPYVGGVALHPNNLLRRVLTCSAEPKWKVFLRESTPPLPPQSISLLSTGTTIVGSHSGSSSNLALTQPIRPCASVLSPVRVSSAIRSPHNSATKASSGSLKHEKPQRRYSECVSELTGSTRPSLGQDTKSKGTFSPPCDTKGKSVSPSRSLSFADVVVGGSVIRDREEFVENRAVQTNGSAVQTTSTKIGNAQLNTIAKVVSSLSLEEQVVEG